MRRHSRNGKEWHWEIFWILKEVRLGKCWYIEGGFSANVHKLLPKGIQVFKRKSWPNS